MRSIGWLVLGTALAGCADDSASMPTPMGSSGEVSRSTTDAAVTSGGSSSSGDDEDSTSSSSSGSESHGASSSSSTGDAGGCLRGACETRLRMPMRADSLPPDSFFVTSGHSGYNCDASTPPSSRACMLDILARRWDAEAGTWTDAPWPGDASPNPETNTVAFGAPLYAPVDGHVVACWREMPDDDIPGDAFRCPGGEEDPDATPPHQCARRGNHLVILTPNGELVALNHLQQSSIPASLCPISGVYLYTDDSVTCGFYDDARLQRPIPIQADTFVGRMGSTGASGKPHLHLAMSQAYLERHDGADVLCRGDQFPLEFWDAWFAPMGTGPIEPEDWTPLMGERLPIDGSVYALFPEASGIPD